jgi:hypothetical protein
MRLLYRFSLSSVLVLCTVLANTSSVTLARPSDLRQTSNTRSADSDMASSPSSLLGRGCTNAVSNPSFETSLLAPWACSATGSWASRSVLHAPFPNAHSGGYMFHGHSNSTNASTVTLSQPDLRIPNGRKVGCSAWVSADGGQGVQGTVAFDMFLDGVWCGGARVKAGDRREWKRIGSEVVVHGEVHTLSVVAMVDAMGELGAGTGAAIDDVWAWWC